MPKTFDKCFHNGWLSGQEKTYTKNVHVKINIKYFYILTKYVVNRNSYKNVHVNMKRKFVDILTKYLNNPLWARVTFRSHANISTFYQIISVFS